MTGCFICPIYDQGRDFEFGYEFVESAVRNNLVNDLYFIFSSKQQQDKFILECEKRFHAQPNGLVLEKNLSDSKNPVTIKKFYGIKVLAERYNYIAAVDCECIFTKHMSAGTMLDNIWQAGTYLAANRSIKGADVVLRCAIALGLQHDPRIIEETNSFKYTWWFNEIPVYRTADIDSFFDWLEKNDYLRTIYYNWYCFDYLVYGIWMILEKNMKLKKYAIGNLTSIIEALWRPEIPCKMAIEKKVGTHWTARVNLGTRDNPNIYMQFHRDRRNTRFRQCFGRTARTIFYRLKHPRNKIIE